MKFSILAESYAENKIMHLFRRVMIESASIGRMVLELLLF
jgi:hypothetical protein